jgi:hypothetical protein
VPRISKRQRLEAHVEALRKAFITPWPVVVVFAPREKMPSEGRFPLQGVTYREGKTIYIMINVSLPAWAAHQTLNHEWAHAIDWRPSAMEAQRASAPSVLAGNEAAQAQHIHEAYHDDHFYLDLGRIERAWEGWDI